VSVSSGALIDSGERAPAAQRPDGETEWERLTRNFDELLQELRVAIPGVQVLFAFLLVAPFNAQFSRLTPGQERLYLASLLCAGCATALLIAPTAHHRLTFRLQDKQFIVKVGNAMAVAGLTFLALAMTIAIALVVDVVFGAVTAAVCTALVGGLFALLWLASPLRRRRRAGSHSEQQRLLSE
jgi:O-antigen/teichoic acid export membrane protein